MYPGDIDVSAAVSPPADPLLQAISDFGATISGAPNFAYALATRRAQRADIEALDLSKWSLAFCGAERVDAEVMRRFAAKFSPSGFRESALYPCYGLAEATLFVTGGRRGSGLKIRKRRSAAAQGVELETVGCGSPAPEHHLMVVDPETLMERRPGSIGEIWVRGPSVAQGYWGRREEAQSSFSVSSGGPSDARYLRTGDLGFVEGDELYLVGRMKELVIVAGRNVLPRTSSISCGPASPRSEAAGSPLLNTRTPTQSSPGFTGKLRPSFSVACDRRCSRLWRQASALARGRCCSCARAQCQPRPAARSGVRPAAT